MLVPLLLLEDNQADAHLLMNMLQKTDDLQWQVIHADRLKNAIDYLSCTQFEIVLLDLFLPDSQGLETVIRIRDVVQNLPIVVLTEIDDRQLALQALAQGAQDYLVKSQLTPEMLLRAIRYAIERSKILKQLQAEVQERQRSEQTLRLIVEGTASVTGKDFFHSLVRSLAEALNARYAFITECIENCPGYLRTIAFWQGDEFGENFEYDVHDTPCEQVVNSRGCRCYPNNLQALFPNETDLVEMEAVSYSGIALLNRTGTLMGHLAVLNDKPMETEPRNTALLEIFAARAVAEMEREQAEEAMRISQEKFSTAFRSSPSGISISTLKDGRYIEVNDSYLRMLEYSRGEMLGQSALELGIWLKAEDRTQLSQMLQVQGAVSNLEIEFRKKSGQTFLGLVSAEVVDLGDEPCLLSVTTDITVLKQADQALERLAEIGELAAMIVHEVRNPLTTMLMGLKSFKRLELTGQFQEYLALALEEGERLQRLLNQILLYAKPQLLETSELELNCMISEMLPTLNHLPVALGKQLKFRSNLSPALVMADKDKIKQVLINLVSNALEAIDSGEQVTVTLEQTLLDQLCIEVHNGGQPIPAEVLVKLTKPFFTTKSNGNGLGLAIVKRIVEAHNGKLMIESAKDTGTKVKVYLPLKA
jgi:two-component system, sporulation sensor kinase A